MTKHYELLYLVPANYTEEELEPIKKKVKDLIAKFEGEITLEDTLGKKKLAYPIGKNSQGYYLIYEFYLDGKKLSELDKSLKLTNEVLRHMLVEKKFQSPSLVRQTEQKIRKQEAQIENEAKAKPEADDKSKIKLEDLDNKLDEILEGNML